MKGVLTDNNVNGTRVQLRYNGESVDSITCLTVYTSLAPHNFTALLPPTSDKNSPQDAMNYYRAYRARISKVVSDPTQLTPHLDRSWHIGDKLADITTKHTVSVWKHSAKAFVYGFVYNTIKVDTDGTVTFGEHGNDHFKYLHMGETSVDFLTPDQRADLSNSVYSEEEKNDILNSILNHIFVRLTNDPELTTAIIADAESRMEEDHINGKTNFIKKSFDSEELADSKHYRSILEVIDGYYRGSLNAQHLEENYTVETAQYMFDILITTMFNQVKDVTKSPSQIKTIARKTIELLYKKAICDESTNIDKDSIETSDEDNFNEEIDVMDELNDVLGELASTVSKSAIQRPFAHGGRFELNNALRMVDQLLRKSEI